MRWCLSFLLFTSVVWTCLCADAQSNVIANPTAKDAKDKVTPPASPSMVPPDVPVIKIEGLCSGDPSSSKPGTSSKATAPASNTHGSQASNKSAPANPGCETVVTRAQYEKLAGVVAPKQEPPATVQLAHFYATQMVYAEKARELGLDKQPRFEEVLKFTYLQVLARAFTNEMQQKANAKADAEFDQYFKQHPEEFELASVLQISVPKQKLEPAPDQAGATPAPKVDNAPDPAALKAEADKIRARAIAGEDFEKLETEVYTFAGDPDSAPDTDMGAHTRADLGEFGNDIFALPPGQVSQVLSGTEAWHIFKLVSKETMSPEDGKKRIAAKFMKETMESVNHAVNPQFNDAYFGPAASEKTNPVGGATK
jgi:PPIC-type PPIASE domain